MSEDIRRVGKLECEHVLYTQSRVISYVEKLGSSASLVFDLGLLTLSPHLW